MIILPDNNWHQWLTFKCNFACDYCIMGERQLGGGTPKYRPKEMSGKQIVDFWNNVEHPPMKRLSVIGGEPTVHKDFEYIINNLEGYYMTVTTNCGSRFFKDDDFVNKLRTHPSSHLRMNTSFHPDFITPEKYTRVVGLMLEAGIHVDQTAFVLTPEFTKHIDKLQKVANQYPLRADTFLGFWNEQEGFEAAFDPENAWPPKNLPDNVKAHTGIIDVDIYKQACMQAEKYTAHCDIVDGNFLVGPSGMVYHCHYKLYNEIDPMCHISDLKPVTKEDKICNHYGYCLSCDAPKLQKDISSSAVKLNTLLNKDLLSNREVQHLGGRLKAIAEDNKLYFSEKTWLESAYAYLYSGHKHACRVAYYGREEHSFLKYLTTKKYRITNFAKEDKSIWKYDFALLSDLDKTPADALETIRKIGSYLNKKGILMFTLDVGNKNISDKETLMDEIVQPLLEDGYIIQGGTESIDDNLFSEDSLTENYLLDGNKCATAVICLRNEKE